MSWMKILSPIRDYCHCAVFLQPRYLLTGRMGLDQGHIIAGEAQGQSVDFTKILFSANLLKRFPVPNWLTKNRSYYNFILKANAQYAEKLLSSVEQFSLGGPSAARAFSVSDVSVDSGVYLGFELHFDLPQSTLRRLSLPSDSIKPFLFFDYGYGVARKLNSNDDNRDAEVKGWGVGFRMSWPRLGVANLIFAKPLAARFDSGLSDATGESRVYFDVTYEFR